MTTANLGPTKIALHGFGSMPIVHRHMIDMARRDGRPIAWCTILTTPHHRRIMGEMLPTEDILDVYRDLPRSPVGGDPTLLARYDGSLAADLAATQRQWRPRPGQWLLARGVDTYQLYKGFLRERGATHILMAGIETPDAKIAVAAARELGLGVLAPVDLRSLSGTMFSTDSYETPPAYAAPTTESRRKAAAFISQFRQKWLPPRIEPLDIDAQADDRTLLALNLPPAAARMRGFLRTALDRPDMFDPVAIRDSVMSNSRLLQAVIWKRRERLNTPLFHVADATGLPRRFIFYPLQYTPESSINVPAPYFVDQFRVIDALRYSMPSDCTLVVKEHRACLCIRPVSFMKRIMGLPGVVIASSAIPARTLIERAAMTVSVTGTAAFEALIAGHPSMALGPGLSAWVTGGPVPVGTLETALRDRMDLKPSDDAIRDRIATLLDARYPFFFATPNMPDEPMLRRGNITRFLAAIEDHIARDRHYRDAAAPPEARATAAAVRTGA